jgi:hypothetical protein
MQLYTAFYAQAYTRVMKPLRIIFLCRLLSWFGIGLSLFYFGERNTTLALWMLGAGLFLFLFTAGFGTIYFHELLGKVFTNEYRGVTWAYRQIFMGLGGIIGGLFVAWFLNAFNNLVLSIAPEEKRPVYFAIQNNLTSLGLFFSIPGGLILNLIGFKPLIVVTILILIYGLFLGLKLKDA